MNYYEAREVEDDKGVGTGIWHFTGMNDGRIWPEGCSRTCRHMTAETACQHWVEFQIAGGVRRVKCGWTSCDNGHGIDDEGRTITCPNPARTLLEVGGPNGGSYTLCDEHASDNVAEALFRLDRQGSFQIASSW